jgi:hypothetical protein
MSRKGPTLLQALIFTISGVLLVFFGCIGAFTGMSSNSNSPLAALGWIAFAGGTLLLATGLGFFATVIIRGLIGLFRNQSAPPADSSDPASTRSGAGERDPNDPSA